MNNFIHICGLDRQLTHWFVLLYDVRLYTTSLRNTSVNVLFCISGYISISLVVTPFCFHWQYAFVLLPHMLVCKFPCDYILPVFTFFISHFCSCFAALKLVVLCILFNTLISHLVLFSDWSYMYCCSVAKHLESANTMFSFIWWIIGFYWVSAGGQVLTHDAPQLYWYI